MIHRNTTTIPLSLQLNSASEAIYNAIYSSGSAKQMEEKISQITKTFFEKKIVPPLARILKSIKKENPHQYSQAQKILVNLFTKQFSDVQFIIENCSCPRFVYRSSISHELISELDLEEHGFGSYIYKDFNHCTHKNSHKYQHTPETRIEFVKIQMLEYKDALETLEALENNSDPLLTFTHIRTLTPLIKKIPLLANLLLSLIIEKKMTLDHEQRMLLYREMLSVDEKGSLEILQHHFFQLGLLEDIQVVGNEKDPCFERFFALCEDLCHLHPALAENAIEYILSDFIEYRRCIYSIFPPEKLQRLYIMLRESIPLKSDAIFANRIKHLFKIFTEQEQKNFADFLKKSQVVCSFGPQSTRAFLQYLLGHKQLPQNPSFEEFLTFCRMISEYGDSKTCKPFKKYYYELPFKRFFKILSIKCEPLLLERVHHICALGPDLIDAFINWISDHENLNLDQETRVLLFKEFLSEGNEKTLKILMKPSDPLGLQKDFANMEKKNLTILLQTPALQLKKVLFILMCRQRISEIQHPKTQEQLRNFLYQVENWCLKPNVVIPIEEEAQTKNAQETLSHELWNFLWLIFSYRSPKYRLKLVDAFFETKHLLFSSVENTNEVKQFSRLLLSSGVENGLSLVLAEMVFQQICTHSDLFKDTQKFDELLNFLFAMNNEMSSNKLDLIGSVLKKILLDTKTILSNLEALNSLRTLFGKTKFFKSAQRFLNGQSLQEIFQDSFDQIFTLAPLKNLPALYEKTFAQFRNPRALFMYAGILQQLEQGEKALAMKALNTYVEAVLTGNFPSIRLQKERNRHIKFILDKQPELEDLWTKNNTLRELIVYKTRRHKKSKASYVIEKNVRIGISLDCQDLLLLGTELDGSCLKLQKDPYHSKALGGFLVGDALPLVIKFKGKMIARVILRVLWCKKTERPVFFLGQIFNNWKENKTIVEALKEEAVSLAREFHMPLLTSNNSIFDNSISYEGEAWFLGGLEAFVYADTIQDCFDGRKPFLFKNLYEVIA